MNGRVAKALRKLSPYVRQRPRTLKRSWNGIARNRRSIAEVYALIARLREKAGAEITLDEVDTDEQPGG